LTNWRATMRTSLAAGGRSDASTRRAHGASGVDAASLFR
jgi:hypothetical protein